MRMRKPLIGATTFALVMNLMVLAPALTGVVAAGSTTRLISAAGTTTLGSTPAGSDAVQFPEIRGAPASAMDVQSDRGPKQEVANRSQSQHFSAPSASTLAAIDPTPVSTVPGVALTFPGLNHRDQRLANNGNQFSLEPPDQGLCVGNGHVLETINEVMRVYNTNGNPEIGTMALNTFYGYPPAINRTTSTFGPFITDPHCYYDSDTGTWFHVVLTLDVDPATGAFLGTNHLDLAVRQDPSPIGTWTIYQIHTENNGTLGQPDHHCSFGFCFGDYPQLGADAYGLYISTNEYSVFGPEFTSANIYALSKKALAAEAATVPMVQFDTVGLDGGQPGFTVWPARSPAGIYDTDAKGTEYFLSSNAADEANGGGSSSDILVWALTNTKSLDTHPDLHLSNASVDVETYSIPPKADQRPGSIPLADCLNDRTTHSPLWGNAAGCWRAFFLPNEQPKNEVLSHLDSHDTRMQQVTLADGMLWGALDTAVEVSGQVKAGITYYVLTPSVSGTPTQVSATIENEETLAVANSNVTYPALAVLPSGEGAMAFTLVGGDYFPSAAWAPVDLSGIGDVHLISPGVGPSDGFTSYKSFVGNPPRTRWGDYGAAVVDGSSIWLASETIEQSCTFAQYVATAFSCGATRTSLANWATRISKVTP